MKRKTTLSTDEITKILQSEVYDNPKIKKAIKLGKEKHLSLHKAMEIVKQEFVEK